MLDALEAVQAAGIATREDFYWTLHAVFVKRHEHSALFDQAFRIFFRKRAYLEKLIAMMVPQAPAREQRASAAGRPAHPRSLVRRHAATSAERETSEVEIDARFTVSDREMLQRKDFAQMNVAEIAAAKEAMQRLVLPLDEVRTRRLTMRPHGHRIDLRRTLRASLKAGGAVIDLKYLGPRTRMPPLVALLDISGSMSQYTRLFLHFLHAVTDARKRVSTFLYGTRLTNVTRALKAKDPDEALAACAESVQDWSGGTRIATSLHAFNKQWARRVLTQGAVVLLITDGLERDPDERLAFEIDRLHRSCRRLIWLNPLLRFEGFEARARGVRTMLPHVDEFRPIHNLEAMAELVPRAVGRRAAGGRSEAMVAAGRMTLGPAHEHGGRLDKRILVGKLAAFVTSFILSFIGHGFLLAADYLACRMSTAAHLPAALLLAAAARTADRGGSDDGALPVRHRESALSRPGAPLRPARGGHQRGSLYAGRLCGHQHSRRAGHQAAHPRDHHRHRDGRCHRLVPP